MASSSANAFSAAMVSNMACFRQLVLKESTSGLGNFDRNRANAHSESSWCVNKIVEASDALSCLCFPEHD
jgi:hypothetical protein